ncbi:hypothetical protein F7725_022398 [Dissostichus mawsoni]|uniref:Uncharacterized protein n=1 Tax=Dissostichus mawsoni TaxID=36200 RepID=A0A7J5YYT8_DISMA|nr:hypothetical protein F7725_022398 [Dissostichus mawsoni]
MLYVQRLDREVVCSLPEVVPINGKNRVSHPESPALVSGEPREDLGDEDGHPVLAPPLNTDPQPARLLFDNPNFPHSFRRAVRTDGHVSLSRPKAGPGTAVAGSGASKVRVCAVIRVFPGAIYTVVAVVLTPTDTPEPRAAATPPTPMVLVLVLVLTRGWTATMVPRTLSRVVSVRHAISQAHRRVVVVPVVAPLSACLRFGR